MSADNGIYILQTKDGFRVIHAQAIENLYWWMGEDGYWKEKNELNPKVIYDYFHRAKVWATREEALAEADRKYQDIMNDDFCPILEYGINFINGMEDKDFPTEGSPPEDDVPDAPIYENDGEKE